MNENNTASHVITNATGDIVPEARNQPEYGDAKQVVR
jgi:hypothetical protein